MNKRIAQQHQKARRMARVSELMLAGHSETEMIAILTDEGYCESGKTVSTHTIHTDKREIRGGWKSLLEQNSKELAAEELARLRGYRQELIDAWHKSKKPIETEEEIKGTIDGKVQSQTKRKIQGRNPDPRYMEILLKVQARINEITGFAEFSNEAQTQTFLEMIQAAAITAKERQEKYLAKGKTVDDDLAEFQGSLPVGLLEEIGYEDTED